MEVAKSAIADIQQPPEQEAAPGGGEEKGKEPEGEVGEKDELRKATLDKLENASEDSLLGQASSYLAALFCSPFLAITVNKADWPGFWW